MSAVSGFTLVNIDIIERKCIECVVVYIRTSPLKTFVIVNKTYLLQKFSTLLIFKLWNIQCGEKNIVQVRTIQP